MKQAVPWVIAGALAASTIGVYVQSQNALKAKDIELQAAETKYQSLVNESSAKLRETQARVETAQTEAKRTATEATTQLQAIANETNTKLQALTNEANMKLQAASLPEVPVAVAFHTRLFSDGAVAAVKNMSRQAIAVTITAARPTSNEQRSFRQVIDSQQAKEIGQREGWAFVNGDVLQVSLANYKPKQFVYNQSN